VPTDGANLAVGQGDLVVTPPARSLTDAAAEAAECTKCALSAGRTQVVYGVGSADADLMFIGEGPGANEDRQGEPFVVLRPGRPNAAISAGTRY